MVPFFETSVELKHYPAIKERGL